MGVSAAGQRSTRRHCGGRGVSGSQQGLDIIPPADDSRRIGRRISEDGTSGGLQPRAGRPDGHVRQMTPDLIYLGKAGRY